MPKPSVEIDGDAFDDLAGFYVHALAAIGTAPFGGSLDGFNDVLRGGMGTPDGGFVLRWLHSARSREVLGYAATVRHVEAKLRTCHPANVAHVQADLEAARRAEGQTLFDILVDIIRCHGPGGDEADDGVELVLA